MHPQVKSCCASSGSASLACWHESAVVLVKLLKDRYNNNKHLRCGNRKGLLGRNDQTHYRMDPNTKKKFKASRPPTKQY